MARSFQHEFWSSVDNGRGSWRHNLLLGSSQGAGSSCTSSLGMCDDVAMAAGRSVVVLPGRNFGAYVPQLFFPMMAAVRRDAEPVAVTWRDVEAVSEMGADELPGWVSDQVRCDLSGLEPESTLVVGKSLGSYAAGLVAELGFPAIWVTPVLISDEIVAALRRAHSPFLLTGGTADDLWISDVARELTPHVLEIDGADHGLFVQGPLDQSAHNMGLLAAACESFIDAYVWTSREHADEPA